MINQNKENVKGKLNGIKIKIANLLLNIYKHSTI